MFFFKNPTFYRYQIEGKNLWINIEIVRISFQTWVHIHLKIEQKSWFIFPVI